MRLFLSALFALSLFACSRADSPAPLVKVAANGESPLAGKINVDLPEASRALLVNDFARLAHSPIRDRDTEATKIFGVPYLDRAVLTAWLTSRVKAIVSDQFLSTSEIQAGVLPAQVVILSNNRAYENPSQLPDALRQASQASQAKGGDVSLGENLGIGLYVLGKVSSMLYGVRFPGSEEFLPVTSPRFGLLALGHSLFDNWIDENIRFQDKTLKGGVDSLLASEYRLGILFHEARHSDGNGKSLGFLHTKCPLGHDYAKQVACDSSLNGAYSVQAQYYRLMARDCKDCSEKEREVLRVFTLDSFSRVLPVNQVRVSEEEALLRCGDLLRDGKALPPKCYYDETPTTNWDSAPEGLMVQ